MFTWLMRSLLGGGARPVISVGRSKFKIDGHDMLRGSWSGVKKGDLIGALGKPSRSVKEYATADETISIWDDIGVTCAISNDKSKRVKSFSIFFKKQEAASAQPRVRPNVFFPGELWFGWTRLNPDWEVNRFQRHLGSMAGGVHHWVETWVSIYLGPMPLTTAELARQDHPTVKVHMTDSLYLTHSICRIHMNLPPFVFDE